MFRLIEARIAPDFAPTSILEYGCGIGRLAIPLARRAARRGGMVTAVDRSAVMLDLARREAERRRIVNISFASDAELRAGSQTFNFPTCYLVLQRLPEDEGLKLLRDLLARLAPGGIAVLSIPYHATAATPTRALRWLRERVPPLNSLVNLALVHESSSLKGPETGTRAIFCARGHTEGMNSRVYPPYKTKYRVANWASYDRALVGRGDVTLWVSAEAIASWEPAGVGSRGWQRKYSDVAIETALTLRLLFHLPLRQAKGFLQSLFGMMGLELSAPDHTTLSRRGQQLDLRLDRVPTRKGVHLIIDSTGLSIRGEGEWAAAKHGGHGRRGWKKLHLGVDRSGAIVAYALTEATVDDGATRAIELMRAVGGSLASVTGDAAYDAIAIYEAAAARGATVVVPPTKTARVSRRRPRSSARDRTIRRVKRIGRRQWKKESGYHRQARVENGFFRYKSIIGSGLRARTPKGQAVEALLGCTILNRIAELGRPKSYSSGP